MFQKKKKGSLLSTSDLSENKDQVPQWKQKNLVKFYILKETQHRSFAYLSLNLLLIHDVFDIIENSIFFISIF